MIELRHNTEQVIRVGVLVTKQSKMTDPLNPVYGALLSWYYWRYIVKADGSVQDILTRTWVDITNCAGCYFLTLTISDTSILGPLILYIYDAGSLGKPIFMEFEVVSQVFWDAKYNNDCLSIECQAQKG
jgi:hypothetical protein